MKNNNCVKVVYRKDADGVYTRSNGRTLWQDFPFLPFLGEVLSDNDRGLKMYIFKVHFNYNGSGALAWIDKHDNVIVRYVNLYKQTKIDF